MAKLSKDDVLKLANLARLSLDNKEVESFIDEINQILDYVDTLQSVDLDGLEPTIQVTGLQNVTRKDEVKTYQASPQDLLKTAVSTEGTLLKVKRVIQ